MAAYTTIDNPELYFQCKIYTGNGSATHAITFDGDEDMQPDLVWIKNRSSAENHALVDSVRGVGKQLLSNSTAGEYSNANSVKAFNSNGFSVGDLSDTNGNTNNLVAWCWKETATAGFDIVSYTGNGSDRTISHSLSAVPKAVIIKTRGSADAWVNFFPALDITLAFDSTNANNHSSKFDGFFNSTDPTSSVFSIGDDDQTNKNTDTFIAYLFAEKQGFSKFGSYTGNGNADGTFVYTGFRPAWILIKRSSTAGNDWGLFDNKRLGYNVDNEELRPSAADAEQTDDRLDILSNGFKIRLAGAGFNASGDTFVYMAFAEQPFVNSNGVPANAR